MRPPPYIGEYLPHDNIIKLFVNRIICQQNLETFALDNDRWTVTDLYTDDDEARAEPFDAVTFTLGDLWARGA